ncbi:MAG: DUF4296 domain-containing protein [Ferruginibacter sp.]|nr:DUF4296 domain-containing protein [Ferruginibacter sp.]
MRFGLYVGCLIFILMSCTGRERTEKALLSFNKMDSVMWEMMAADVYFHDVLGKDSSKETLALNAETQAAILKKYQVSRADYFATLDYYSARPNLFLPLLDSMLKHKLREERRERSRARFQHIETFNK